MVSPSPGILDLLIAVVAGETGKFCGWLLEIKLGRKVTYSSKFS